MDIDAMTHWTPTTTAVSTTLRSVAPTNAPGLASSVSGAFETLLSQGSTIDNLDYVSASRIIRGGQASLTIISAQEILATATGDDVKSEATQRIWEATENLLELAWEENVYDIYRLSRPANIIFLVIFAILVVTTILMWYKSRYWWFNVAWTCGTILEFLGYLGRVLSFGDMTNFDYYILQLVCLTLSPVFLMAGIYFLFGQLVVIHGRHYSWLRPMFYSYIFVTCDVISLVVQAVGGGLSAVAASEYDDVGPGTDTMIAGIAFQVFSMSIFLLLWFRFVWSLYFKDVQYETTSNPLQKKSLMNFLKLLFNTKNSNEYKQTELEKFYVPKYHDIRARKLYNYYALAVTGAVIVIFIRCIYRVVELAQGFTGYLITHEVYIMTLDATMVTICCLIFVPFHPQIVMGSGNVIGLRNMAKSPQDEVECRASAEFDKEDKIGLPDNNNATANSDSGEDSTYQPTDKDTTRG
ncbi:Sphingoid long-chain base transporter RSB1 [Candida viswanathii]|uniref:Sphingoid long-chain base transporter RSB1 n=1 Tax=Candida viswanathii TaxID=5486 RepID=A0A367XN03_9ASCO|nr:Sphingoid long-chain base transporter RSB1 [Candida viswanathii]